MKTSAERVGTAVSRVFGAWVLAWVFGAIVASCGGESRARTAEELYTDGAVQRFYLTLDAEARDKLGKKPRKYVRATFRYGGTIIPNVGLRFKGHRSMRKWAEKPAFKVRFDKFVEGQTFLGLRKLTLNNMVEDSSMLNEMLGYDLYRAMGVPTPRASYAEVWVNGEPYGLYLNLESIDRGFLDRNFSDGSGSLYEGEYGCDLNVADVEGFDLDAGEAGPREDLTRLCRIAEDRPAGLFGGDSAPFASSEALAYLAVSVFIGDFDGYRHSHNYRLYHDPTLDRWYYLPWGIDRIYKRHLEIYDIHGRGAQLCFEDAICRVSYVSRMQDVLRVFKSIDWEARIEQLDELTQDAVAADPRRPYSRKRMAVRRKGLAAFIRERPARIETQVSCLVDGKTIDRDHDGYSCDDCDDGDPAIHPGATERCDEIDNDCSGIVDDGPSCPCKRLKVGKRRFRLCSHAMTWVEAARFCEAQGFTLARISSRTQSKALHKALIEQGDARAWIGLSDADGDGRFAWRDGKSLGFARWGKGQPDDDGCSERCVSFKKKGRGHWYNTHCGVRRPFVCRE
ncbi:MAG: CotH kinase family protein [Nannocystaceae bacterium]